MKDKDLMSIESFGKIYALGSKDAADVIYGKVEVTEKIDGSQFAFGINSKDKLLLRSKGQELKIGQHPEMFREAVLWVRDNEDTIRAVLDRNMYVYGEFLRRPKHNILCYDRIPLNNIIVFAVKENNKLIDDYDEIKDIADALELETVPLLYRGTLDNLKQITQFIGTTSHLGRVPIEGVVVKNYAQGICAKYVSDDFKEVMGSRPNRSLKSGSTNALSFLDAGAISKMFERYMSEARYHKAVQRLQERGDLDGSVKDIGSLMKEVIQDLLEEEGEAIEKEGAHIIRRGLSKYITNSIPRWYKNQLFNSTLKGDEPIETQ